MVQNHKHTKVLNSETIIVKSQLITSLAAQSTLSETTVRRVFDEIFSTFFNKLEKKGRIEIRGLGSWTLQLRAARKAHNPRTLAIMVTPQKQVVRFRPSKLLKQRINKK